MKTYIYLIIIVLLYNCSTDGDTNTNNDTTGKGGSLAQFTIKDNYLYTVDQANLNVFNINNLKSPVQVNTVNIGFNIETLFNDKQYLYIGSQTGMFIYGIENPETPKKLAEVSHFRACDPVVANSTHAYVTLDSSAGCGTSISALQIYDTKDINNPKLVSSRNLIAPKGLALYNNYLFVCDDEVKIFDITNPEESLLVNSINISAFDVIIRNNHAFIIGDTSMYQYEIDPNNIKNIKALSVIPI